MINSGTVQKKQMFEDLLPEDGRMTLMNSLMQKLLSKSNMDNKQQQKEISTRFGTF